MVHQFLIWFKAILDGGRDRRTARVGKAHTPDKDARFIPHPNKPPPLPTQKGEMGIKFIANFAEWVHMTIFIVLFNKREGGRVRGFSTFSRFLAAGIFFC